MKRERHVAEEDFPPKDINEELDPQKTSPTNYSPNDTAFNFTNKTEVRADAIASVEDDLNYTFKIYKDFKICIYKPLIPLKLTLFCWFGSASALSTFLSVFLKQRGLTLVEFSTAFIITPVVQTIAPTVSGIVADKLGRSKPVLVVNLLLTVVFAVGMLLVPRMNVQSNNPEKVNLQCHREEFDMVIANTSCSRASDFLKMEQCNMSCTENIAQHCYGKNMICDLLGGNKDFENFSLSIYVNETFEGKNQCYYNASSITYNNISFSWCKLPLKMYCSIECLWDQNAYSTAESGSRSKFVIMVMIFLILFYSTFSNVYRILDATSMSLAKKHNSDFGRERFFSIFGSLVFSPIARVVVGASTAKGAEKNYASAFYLFIGLVALTLAIIYKLDVQLNPPGKKMWKKSVSLMRNPDVVVFILIVFVLGTAWIFRKNYGNWYLEELNAPSFLLGIVPAINSVYGLPFLLTSNFWVKKIGTTQLLVLGLLGHAIAGTGYSFLVNPWLSLILEASDIFSYHLLWVAVITHSNSIAPDGLTATVIATTGAVHYSVGKASGSLIGGLIMNSFGGRKAYRAIAIICFISALFYGLYLYVRRTCCAKKFSTSETRDVAELEPVNC